VEPFLNFLKTSALLSNAGRTVLDFKAARMFKMPFSSVLIAVSLLVAVMRAVEHLLRALMRACGTPSFVIRP
jgi:energy-coupling factor transporter transmembrane protein EcfT